MKSLILKLNAAGDVVRTSVLLHRLQGSVTWVTSAANMALLAGTHDSLRCVSWEERNLVLDDEYDLLINLEYDLATAQFACAIRHHQLFGAYIDAEKRMRYTVDSKEWFDMGLISSYGKKRADALKYENRSSYQELLFSGLGWHFSGEEYLLPKATATNLSGDVAIAPVAGTVWPMKNWAHYDRLGAELERRGLRVNVLPKRESLLEHLGDVSQHRCLVSGDSLPMHLALGTRVHCVTIFNCTSPWEIYDYGLQVKLVSPLLKEHFYSRRFDPRAATSVALGDVVAAVLHQLEGAHE
jgi:heptosyltransferase-2